MKPRIYELSWQVETDVHSFYHRELRVFRSEVEARQYGKEQELELNNGMSIERRAQDGFYYKFIDYDEIKDIDGFPIELKER